MNVETKGRWWVVGSGWAGSVQPTKPKQAQGSMSVLKGATVDLMELAAKHKMNTDTRKAAFCILMSSEDYQDAVSKLFAMGFKSNTKDIAYPRRFFSNNGRQLIEKIDT